MMNNIETSKIDLKKVKAAASTLATGRGQSAPAQTEPYDEDKSKDAFFVQVAEMAEAMIERHGKEFAIGTLVLAAKFIAEGRPLTKPDAGDGVAESAVKSG
jgi:hypothetical protein